jgi:hypothetical protein
MPRRNRFIELVHAIVDGAEVDEGARTQRIEPRHFFEMVGGAGEVVEQEADRGDAVVDVGDIGAQGQRLQVELAGLVVLALSNCLLGALTQSFDVLFSHGGAPAWEPNRRRKAAYEEL